MRGIDELDDKILKLLNEDARRPYSDIAEEIGVSQPTVSNRVDRLRELGIIHRFTLDLDRSIISDGVSVLIDIDTSADTVDSVGQAFQEENEAHAVYTTADSHVLVMTVCRPQQVHDFVARTVSDSAYTDYEVKLLTNAHSTPSIPETTFSVECAHCENTVVPENGVSTRFNGTLYYFCCELCEDQFTEKYETLRNNA